MSHYTERLELSRREKAASQGSMAAAIERQRKNRRPTEEENEVADILESRGLFGSKEGTRILEIVESLTDRIPK